MMTLVERAVNLVRTHPDAESVAVHLDKLEADTTAAVDTKQMERAQADAHALVETRSKEASAREVTAQNAYTL